MLQLNVTWPDLGIVAKQNRLAQKGTEFVSHAVPSVLLVDDHPLFRKGLHMLLAASELGQTMFYEAGSIDEALGLDVDVDLVLLDISMPGRNGLSGIADLRNHWPEANVVILSGFDHQELARDAALSGASGFMSKTLRPEVICAHVRRWLVQRPTRGAFEVAEALDNESDSLDARVEVLPPRQYEVLKLLAQGFSNKAIAKRLETSEHTVRNQVVAVMRHFGAQTRVQAVVSAQRQGVLPVTIVE